MIPDDAPPRWPPARLAFYPAFTMGEELTDQYHRALWYLRPVAARIAQVSWIAAPGLAPGPRPAYLDPAIAAGPLADKLRLVPAESAEAVYAEADYILHWDTSAPIPPGFAGKLIEDVDRRRHVEECQVWLNLSNKIGGSYFYRVQESHRRFKDLVQSRRARRAYVFGTGPNLAQIEGRDFSDGVSIVCNSIVKNEALLDQLKPALIVACDPIFHAGASAYAGAFRAALHRAMRRTGAYFLCGQRDYRVFAAAMPEDLQHRLIGGPAPWGLSLNTRLMERFAFTACPNVLTNYLLPAAVALGEEIYIAGCDGRPLAERGYFWRHNESVQFTDQMQPIQEAHPAFFDIDYDDYYLLHCQTVEAWVKKAERAGRRVAAITASHIPALAARYEGGARAEPLPLAARLRMRQVFLRRQYTALRHGLAPRWKRRALQGLARAFGG